MIPQNKDPLNGKGRERNHLRGKAGGRANGSSARDFSAPRKKSTFSLVVIASLVFAAISASAIAAAPRNTRDQQPALLTSLNFPAVADAFVASSPPSKNYGTSNYLQAGGSSRSGTRSYIRFSVSGLTGPIGTATLHLYATTDGTINGPAVYRAGNNWTESGKTGITWKTQPAQQGSAVDNKGAIPAGTWVSYDVTSVVTGNGTYTFALIPDSSDGVTFSSREGANPPQLIIGLPDTPTPAPTGSVTPVTPGPSSPIAHIFVVVMENHSYAEVWNTSSTPYITQLGTTYARAIAYHATTHPSLPNYLDLYGGSHYGITTDCSPSSTCHANARNLADNLAAKGLTWKGYMESMPAPCTLTVSGSYAPKHNPFIYFDDILYKPVRCANHVVPFSALSTDLASAATTPNFAFITPNQCNDMHNCSVSTGDTWLKNHLPAILRSPACTVDNCLLMLTWDEDDHSSGNQVLTIFAGPAAKTGGATSAMPYTHFSLLRTIEYIFGLPTQTGNDAAASPMLDLLR